MLKINDREWKEFYLNELFVIKSGKRLTVADMDQGEIPFIGATDANNGITNWIATPNASYDKNVLGVNYNGSVVENFYHKYGCVFSDDVKRLHLKFHKDNKYILLFFKTIILQQKIKYAYGYKFNGLRMGRQKILVPVNEEGNPDYDFMEQFVKEREEIKRQEYIKYCTERTDFGGGYFGHEKLIPSISLNDREWKCFYISNEKENGIFELRASLSGIDKNKLLHSETTNLPYVTRSGNNNGISSFVGNIQHAIYEKDIGNVITIGLDTQTVFYQPYDFYTGQNIQVLSNNHLNEFTAKFMIPLLKNQVSKLSWGGNGATLGRLERMQFLLPVNDESEPDYEFMENYIKEREFIKMQEYLDYCNCIMKSY